MARFHPRCAPTSASAIRWCGFRWAWRTSTICAATCARRSTQFERGPRVSSPALRPLAPADRIAAIADPHSVERVDDALSARRPSPHLARWGIDPHDDDGVVLARATIFGAPVLLAAQDEHFLGGSAGVNHADALRALFQRAREMRPAAVVLLAASGGVRLYEAHPAVLARARVFSAMHELRVLWVRVHS